MFCDQTKFDFPDENGSETGDMLNNNFYDAMSVDFIDNDELFNMSQIDEYAPASADFFSKSLNDIHTESIPQNGLRPKLFAFKSDDLFFSVSICHSAIPSTAMTLDKARRLF